MKLTSLFLLALALGICVGTADTFARGGRGRFGGRGGFGFGPTTQGENHTLVRKGQLTPAEVERLKAQDTALQKLSDTLTGAAKLTKDELNSLGDAVDAASFAIWSRGSDEEGKILSKYGSKIFCVDELSQFLESGPLTRTQARELIANLRAIITARIALSEDELTADQRTTHQKKLETIATKYYTTK